MLVDTDGNLICQHRDGNTKNSPNMVSFFGGELEPTDATPADGAAREANEETNRQFTAASLEYFTDYIFEVHPGVKEKIYLYVSRGHTTEGLQIYEGQGYYVLKSPTDPLIAPVVQHVVDAWFALSLDARRRPPYPKSNAQG